MTAHVINGRIELDDPVALPEGAKLEVALAADEANRNQQSVLDHIAPLIGVLDGLPDDLARNHDHYLHGREKK